MYNRILQQLLGWHIPKGLNFAVSVAAHGLSVVFGNSTVVTDKWQTNSDQERQSNVSQWM